MKCVGLVVGMIRFIWQFSYLEPPCTQMHLDTRPKIISEGKLNHMTISIHDGIIIFHN